MTRFRRPIAVLVAALLLAAACATLTTKVTSDPRADFSKFRTFTITGDRLQTAEQAWLGDEIATRLQAHGLSRVPENASLRVEPRLFRQATAGESTWGYSWWSGNATGESSHDVPAGTLVVDLVDPARNQLVWRGLAKGTVPAIGALQKGKVEVALDRLFADFPPKTPAK
ncbi:MAG TPA: DUF4136 domain-containing protein [Thermoanaerobaculia bacterium]|nr:DUF4136 domain-containing protein [Thermoanaerobaculia bacterium]